MKMGFTYIRRNSSIVQPIKVYNTSSSTEPLSIRENENTDLKLLIEIIKQNAKFEEDIKLLKTSQKKQINFIPMTPNNVIPENTQFNNPGNLSSISRLLTVIAITQRSYKSIRRKK